MGFFKGAADNLDQWKAYGAQQRAKSAVTNAAPVKPMVGPDPRAQKMVGPSPIKPQPPMQDPATKNSPQLLAAAKVFNNQQAASKGVPAPVAPAMAPKAPMMAAPPPAAKPPLQQPAMAPKPMQPLARGPSAMPKVAFTTGFDKAAKALTTKTRDAIPKKEFAIPEEGKFPIHDRAHAANAKARASGTKYESRVNAAVHKKYPDMGGK